MDWECLGAAQPGRASRVAKLLQNCCEGRGHPRVQTQQHEVFLHSLLNQEQEELPADFPDDSGLLPGFKIYLPSCIRAGAHDAEIGGILLRELSSTYRQG